MPVNASGQLQQLIFSVKRISEGQNMFSAACFDSCLSIGVQVFAIFSPGAAPPFCGDGGLQR